MEEDPYRSILTMGNDSYLVAFDFMGYGERGGICVYSFEEDVPLAGGQSTGLWDDVDTVSDDADSNEAMGDDDGDDDVSGEKREKCSWLDMRDLKRSILRRREGLNVWD